MNNLITDEKVKKYFSVTQKALKKAKINLSKKTHLEIIANDFYNMAKTYFDDALYFYENKDLVLTFGALNYSHGWLDSGARLGLFDVEYDDKLFTIEKPDREK